MAEQADSHMMNCSVLLVFSRSCSSGVAAAPVKWIGVECGHEHEPAVLITCDLITTAVPEILFCIYGKKRES